MHVLLQDEAEHAPARQHDRCTLHTGRKLDEQVRGNVELRRLRLHLDMAPMQKSPTAPAVTSPHMRTAVASFMRADEIFCVRLAMAVLCYEVRLLKEPAGIWQCLHCARKCRRVSRPSTLVQSKIADGSTGNAAAERSCISSILPMRLACTAQKCRALGSSIIYNVVSSFAPCTQVQRQHAGDSCPQRAHCRMKLGMFQCCASLQCSVMSQL